MGYRRKRLSQINYAGSKANSFVGYHKLVTLIFYS